MRKLLITAALVGAGIIFGAGYSWAKPYPYEIACVGTLWVDWGNNDNDNAWYLDSDDEMCGALVERSDLHKELLKVCNLEDYCRITGHVTVHHVDVEGKDIKYYEWTEIKKVVLLAACTPNENYPCPIKGP